MNKRLKKYIAVIKLKRPDDKKTDRWEIRRVEDNILVGTVKWHGAWRKYIFASPEAAVYDWDFMYEIGNFCEIKTKEHFSL